MNLKNWKQVLGAGLVSAAAIVSPSSYAAQTNVTVDINLPTILVMYHYNTITLNLDQAALGNYLVGGTALACGTDFCDDQGNSAAIAVNVIAATNNITQAVVDPGLANTSATFTLVDSVGVRALGCSTYTATVVDASVDAGVVVDTATSLSAIDGSGCSALMTTGDLTFTVAFDQVNANPVSAVFDVTITGV